MKPTREAAESLFELACQHYATFDRASVFKRPRQNGDAACDYCGTLSGGQSVAVKLLSSSTDSLPLPERDREGQTPELAQVAAMRGLALVIVRAGLQWWSVAWHDWSIATQYAISMGQESLDADVLNEIGRRLKLLPCGGPDWLWTM